MYKNTPKKKTNFKILGEIHRLSDKNWICNPKHRKLEIKKINKINKPKKASIQKNKERNRI